MNPSPNHPHNKGEVHKTIDQQQQNHRLRTDNSLSYRGGGGGLNVFYWRQIFSLDSVVVKVRKGAKIRNRYN